MRRGEATRRPPPPGDRRVASVAATRRRVEVARPIDAGHVHAMGLVYVEADVGREGGQTLAVRFLVDSGALYSVLPAPL